jgi:hypothetical protein
MHNWQTACDEELSIVFEQAKSAASGFAEPMRSRGLAYLDKFNPLLPGSTKNYICYSLPFWLRDMTGANAHTCRRMSLANVYVMLYFFIQDDLMDTADSEWREQLALAQLYQISFLEIYRAEFPPESPFWAYFRTYIEDWAAAVATEGYGNDPFADPLQLARKAAPVKLASTGLLIKAGLEALVPRVSGLVDQTLVTLQMADDWADWEEDLAEGSPNSLISFIRGELGLAPDEPVAEAQAHDCLWLKGTLRRFAEHASSRHERIEPDLAEAPLMLAFHASLASELRLAADRLETSKQSLLRGGFVDWLSTNLKS